VARSWISAGAFALIALMTSLSGVARGDPPVVPTASPPEKLDSKRYELAGFPIVGGNSDIGFQFGGAATLTRFQDDVSPYFWNIDLLLSASAKDDSNGLRLVQQSHVLRLDVPDLIHNRLRLDTRASFLRTINTGYYGIGNASQVTLPAGQSSPGRRFQYLQQEGRVRSIARIHTGTLVDVALGANLRYEVPEIYAGSKLAEDATLDRADGSPLLVGTEPATLGELAAGVMLDTRDNEFVTTRGIFYQLGVGGTVGSAQAISYGEAAGVFSHYAALGGPFIFATRVIASFQFGRVPFYDQQQAGVFDPQYVLGSEWGVRGVPQGRYAGLVKLMTNVEIRATPFPRFRLFGQRFRIGTTTFVDVGRAWAGYGVDPARDGTTLGLKYGVGGGAFLQWGEAAIFRVEAAYSPDAESENPGFPIGIYVSDGLMF
jgi:hypothetical protein